MSSASTVRSSSIAGEMYCQPNNARHSETSARAAPPYSARKCSSVIIAAIKRSPTARAVTVIAPSATAERAMSGCVIGPQKFCPLPIAMLFSRCLMNSRRWPFKTRGSCMESCFVLWLNPFLSWRQIRNDWEPGLASWPCCTPGPNARSVFPAPHTHDLRHYAESRIMPHVLRSGYSSRLATVIDSAYKIDYAPATVALLDGRERERRHFRAPQTAAEKDREDGAVAQAAEWHNVSRAQQCLRLPLRQPVPNADAGRFTLFARLIPWANSGASSPLSAASAARLRIADILIMMEDEPSRRSSSDTRHALRWPW